MTVKERQELKSLCLQMPKRDPLATAQQIGDHLAFIKAALPSQNKDDLAGKMGATVYVSALSNYTNEAVSYMAKRAVVEHDWFPTPRQCLEIIKEYKNPPTLRARGIRKVQSHAQKQLDIFIDKLKSGPVKQEYIDAQSDNAKRIAETQSLLWFNDGKYTQRFKRDSEQ